LAEKMRKALYDRESDSLYIVISKGPEEGFIELAPDINLESRKERKGDRDRNSQGEQDAAENRPPRTNRLI